MKRLLPLLLLSLCTAVAVAQTSLSGKITDAATGEELIGANVTLSQKGNFVTGTSTDFDGNYRLRLEPGVYEIAVSYVGFPTKTIEDLLIEEGKTNQLDFAMIDKTRVFGFVCGGYKIPLLQAGETSSGLIIPDYEIQPMATKKVIDIIGTAPGITLSR